MLNPVVVIGLALIVGAIPALVITFVFVQLGLGTAGGLANGLSLGRIFGATFFSNLVLMIVSALVQGALTRATVSANEGRRATFGESFSAAARVLLPLVGLSILLGIGIAIGFVLLIVPGIILMLIWAVAVPTLVIERRGIMAAFSRSAELTKGVRLRIFALLLVIGVIYVAISWVFNLIGFGVYSTSSIGGLSVGTILGSLIVTTIGNILWGTIQPSLYVELRHCKEGASLEDLEQVFA
jgi:hypothetical protein